MVLESESFGTDRRKGTMKRATWVDGVGSSASSRSSLRSVGGLCGLAVGGGGSAEHSPATSEKGFVSCKSHASAARNGSQRRLQKGPPKSSAPSGESREMRESRGRRERRERRAKSEERRGQGPKRETRYPAEPLVTDHGTHTCGEQKERRE